MTEVKKSKILKFKCTNANFRIPVKMHAGVKKLAKKLKVSASSLYLKWSITGFAQDEAISRTVVEPKKNPKKLKAESLDDVAT